MSDTRPEKPELVSSRPGPRRLVALGAAALVGALAGDVTAVAGDKGAATSPASVALTVRVNGLNNDRGKVAVALFASAEAFPDQKRALAGQLARIEKGRAAVRFTGLRPGQYAVAVLHDENENAKMDFNFLGMPLEGYGFSNDASAPFGPPSFEAAAFQLKPRDSFVPVRMRYFF
ncbi:MAG TPA: DUF2141 domain-containing protein [Polyangiaceae bacterium]|nr:DUF2141 domain-containing protein [Polyangiaceae bacterium]